MSRIWHDRYGIAVGTTIALVTLWLFLISAITILILRA